MPPVLYLIDGHALAYRTYFALTTTGSSARFQTKSGEPTAGVFGFASVLLRLMEQEHPEYLAVAFDTGRTFRDDLFPAYKGTREKMPDELAIQIKRIREMVDAFNIPRLEIEGFEADDVLGSVARRVAATGMGVKIITGDRDLLQLVDERIVVSLPGKSLADSKDYFPQDVFEHMGVRPDQIVDYKALLGDKSDNIPGVAGIGEKTAAQLLLTYETLDGVYAHLDELSAGVRKRLEAGREAAYLSQTLARIVIDVPIAFEVERARMDDFDPQQVEAMFRELEFRTLSQRLAALEKNYGLASRSSLIAPTGKGQQLSLFGEQPGAAAAPAAAETPPPALGKVHLVDTPEALAALVERLNAAEAISFDTETTSTDQMQADLVGISLSVEVGEGYYIPVGHSSGQQLSLETVIEALRGPMTAPHIPKIGHNIKYDWVMLKRYGLHVTPLGFDTMIAEWLTNPASRNLGLKNLAWVRQGIGMTHIEDLIGKGKKQITMDAVPIQAAADYAAADADVTLRLMPELRREVEACHASQLLKDVEMPLITVIGEMEIAGVALDVGYLQHMSAELAARLVDIEQAIYQQVGEPFNLNSPQQLSTALFTRLKIAPPDRTAKTASGFYSTSAEVLEALRGQHPVMDSILEYRELSKLRSTYLEALPLQVNPRTGRVHTSFNQTGSVTGRIASSEPNLQNIPNRSDLGRQVRRAFVAGPGNLLLSVDYSQIELRIVAHMAQDETMLDAFHHGQDIHAATAAAILDIPIEQVSKAQRSRAKGVNFGLIYGMSPFGLTRYTDLTLAEAENFVSAYFKQFPGVKSYLDGIRMLAAQQGYVETLHGRRRYFPALQSMSIDRNQRMREEREAINAPIQGTAADIMKIAMLRTPAALIEAGLRSRLILQVHDELVLECPADELQRCAAVVQAAMESAYTLSIPLETEARYGQNWGEMQVIQ